jgi:hypothetical protein
MHVLLINCFEREVWFVLNEFSHSPIPSVYSARGPSLQLLEESGKNGESSDQDAKDSVARS